MKLDLLAFLLLCDCFPVLNPISNTYFYLFVNVDMFCYVLFSLFKTLICHILLYVLHNPTVVLNKTC